MNIGEEKEHIYRLMREIAEERRMLTDAYYGLKSRLDDLHKLEMRGIEDLSVKGYVDLYNNIEKQLKVSNLEREAQQAINSINRLVEKNKLEAEKVVEEEVKQVIPDFELAESKFKENKKVIKKDRADNINTDNDEVKFPTPPFKKMVKIIEDVLDEAGRPLKISEIYRRIIEKHGFDMTYKNFQSNTMYRANRETDNNIARASSGFYQLVKNRETTNV